MGKISREITLYSPNVIKTSISLIKKNKSLSHFFPVVGAKIRHAWKKMRQGVKRRFPSYYSIWGKTDTGKYKNKTHNIL